MATKDGKIVDEINGIIASRDSIRTTMLDAGVNGVTNTSKLADLAVNLANAKLPEATYNIEASGSITIPAGKLTTGNQTITAKSLASQTQGNAAAADIRSNKIAWVGGTKVTGTMPDGTYSASVSVTNGSASMTATGVSTTTSSNCYVTLSTAAGSAKGTATIGTGGYIAAGSKESSSTSVNVSGNGTKLYLAINYYYTSLEAPSDSEGNNGDIWLVVNPDV